MSPLNEFKVEIAAPGYKLYTYTAMWTLSITFESWQNIDDFLDDLFKLIIFA